jgi:NADH-quinone oxidoreductase subunit L
VGATAGALGIWLAYRWYVLNPDAPRRFVERIPLGLGPGMYAASVNKYYVDDVYQLVFARGGVYLSNLLWWFDAKVIDGAVNGAGWLASRSGGILRHTQTGRVQNYGLGIATGMVLVLVAYLVIR